jgi:type VI secretion system protein ImpL
MTTLRKILFSKLALTILGVLLIALLIWFIGPLIGIADLHPLDSVLARAFAILVVVAIAGFIYLLSRLGEQRQNNQMAAAVTATASGNTQVGKEEVDELAGRLKEALELLKKSRFAGSSGRKYLYQLPWYVIIGPPGAGKTTALVNSGLSFPLADKLGKGAVKGVGGTRSCDWWFTDEAVLIDTAGRYTTQDSESEQDKAAWTGFLKLLKRHRSRQPLNGVLCAIGISDLTYATEAQRSEHAAAIKQRIQELYAELGVRLPVYVLFTKADLIAGFVEFFDDLPREDRDQVWGITFDYRPGKDETSAVTAYPAEFDGLIGRLDDRLVERLQQETDIQRRSAVFGFPQQVASLKETTDRFLKEIFEPNRFEQPILLRGVYFTSGTQEGTPIDRLMGAMAATFGLVRQQVAGFSGAGRSYFLTRLLRQVVFGEAGLVNADPRVERRNRLIQISAFAVAGLVFLGMVGLWTMSYLGNSALLDKVDATADAYAEQSKAFAPEHVLPGDLKQVSALLDTLRTAPAGYAEKDKPVPASLGFGLYQGDKVGSQEIDAYHRALGGLMLPRLLLRLESQLNGNQQNPDFLYEGLKVYLMLGRQGPLDKALVRHWLALDWTVQFPGDENDALRKDLAAHLDALLEAPLPDIALDGGLVQATRVILNRLPLAERAFSFLKTNPKVSSLPDWRISENAGPAASRVLQRTSGKSLADGIPGIYTYNGFYNTFRPLLPDIAREVAKESWVVGQAASIGEDPIALARLQNDVTALYLNEFGAQWDRLLGDVVIIPFTNVNQGVQTLGILSAPDSPLRALMVSAAKETWLSKPPPTGIAGAAGAAAGAGGVAQAAAAVQAQAQAGAQDRLAQMLGAGTQQPGGVVDQAGRYTDQHFKALHDLADGPPTGPLPIDGTIAALGDLYKSMNKLGATNNQGGALLGAASAGDGGAAQLQANAARLPEPLKGAIAAVTHSSSTLTVGGARSQLNGLWTSSVLPFCRTATENRYPIYKNGSSDVTLDDFSRLFSKGGLIDAFFTTNLAPFVDQSTNPWHWQKVDNLDLGIPQAALTQFQIAAGIRDSMFPSGGGKPGVNFEMVPVTLDATSTQVLIELGGQNLSYDHGPPRGVRMQWPGTGGSGVRVSFQPQTPGEQTVMQQDGVWSWFRLLDQAQLRQAGGPDRFNVTFATGKRTATFEIRADSVINPFASNQLSQFRCPSSL